jgi:hypothetical protein
MFRRRIDLLRDAVNETAESRRNDRASNQQENQHPVERGMPI